MKYLSFIIGILLLIGIIFIVPYFILQYKYHMQATFFIVYFFMVGTYFNKIREK